MKFSVPGFTSSAAPIAVGAHNLPQVDEASNTSNSVKKKQIKQSNISPYDASSDSEIDEKVDGNAQYGTQAAQAMTQVWSENHLTAGYIMYVNAYAVQVCGLVNA
ncbi:hypothetical protein R6Q59_009889 [Mikania micrantha]